MTSVPNLLRKTNAKPQREESRRAPTVEVVAAKQLHLVILRRARGNRAQGVLPALVHNECRAATPAAAVPRHLPQDGVLCCDADVPVMDRA
jgi:hypothetical protein